MGLRQRGQASGKSSIVAQLSFDIQSSKLAFAPVGSLSLSSLTSFPSLPFQLSLSLGNSSSREYLLSMEGGEEDENEKEEEELKQ